MESSNTPNMPTKVEKPYPGITQEWYNDGDIVLYKITGVTQDVVDNWAQLVLDTLKDWPKDKPYLAIHDLSQPGVSLQYAAMVNFDMMNIGITMGGRMMAEEIFDQHTQFTAKVAVNFNLSLSGQTNRTLMSFLNRDHPSIQYKTFYNRTKCLRWLTTGISDTTEMKAVKAGKQKAQSATSGPEKPEADTQNEPHPTASGSTQSNTQPSSEPEKTETQAHNEIGNDESTK